MDFVIARHLVWYGSLLLFPCQVCPLSICCAPASARAAPAGPATRARYSKTHLPGPIFISTSKSPCEHGFIS